MRDTLLRALRLDAHRMAAAEGVAEMVEVGVNR